MRLVAFVVLSLGGVAVVGGQNPPLPTFEVASVRAHTGPPPTSIARGQAANTFRRVNVTAQALILYAYEVADYQLLNIPSWGSADRFDVEGKAGHSLSATEMRLTVRSLLEDRFGLRTHHEARQMAMYSLVPASANGKLGPNLKPNTDDCKSNVSAPANVPAGAVRSAGCSDADWIATMASRAMAAPVANRTGLTGNFEYSMFYSPDGDPVFGRGTTATTPDTGAPHFSTALQEQLGLKLERSQGTVDVLAIDHIERPSEN